MWIVRIFLVIFLVAWTSQVWAQFWIEPAVNFGTTRLNWQDSIELKTSKPSWEVKGEIRERLQCYFSGSPMGYGASLQASVSASRSFGATFYQEEIQAFTVNAQTFGKKNGQAKGQAQAGTGSQETVVVDASCLRGNMQAILSAGYVFNPAVRIDMANVSVTASGKIDGKQVEATEAFTRLYPQVGLAYTHRQGAALVTLLGTVGQRSSHLEASLNWNIRPNAWIGVGGKRDYLGFEQGRVESAAFTVKAGVVF